MDNLKCESLGLRNQTLESEKARALVRAMESNMESVELCDEVRLDIMALAQYSGEGMCGRLAWANETALRYINSIEEAGAGPKGKIGLWLSKIIIRRDY